MAVKAYKGYSSNAPKIWILRETQAKLKTAKNFWPAKIWSMYDYNKSVAAEKSNDDVDSKPQCPRAVENRIFVINMTAINMTANKMF